MPTRNFTRKAILVCSGPVLVAVVITASVLSAPPRRPGQKSEKLQKPQKQVVELPPVISHVPKLRVANINVKNPGTTDAIAVIEIVNTSHLAVMYVELSTKNKGDSGAVSTDGLTDPNNPIVIIPPFGTKTLEMSFGEMIPDAPLVISAAVFADGTEEGDKWALRAMRAGRKRHQELRGSEEKKQKGGPQQ